jgi:guanylate kinase
MSGMFILIIGPSGSGKGALMSALRQERPDIVFPISCTTRAPREGEVEGQMYYFISREQFKQKIKEEAFLEWAEYGGNLYGTLRSEIMPALEAGKTVVREVEVQGARQIETSIPRERLRVIYIDAGSWEELEARIVNRAAIHTEELAKRKERFEDEITFKAHAFRVVRNFDGELEQAKVDFVQAVHDAERS